MRPCIQGWFRKAAFFLMAAFLPAMLGAQPSAILLPLQQRSDLLNGLKVVVAERPGQATTSVVLVTFAGDAADDPGKAGTAWMTAKMLLASTAQRKSAQIAEDLSSEGFQASAYADYDASWIRLSGASKDVHSMLEELSDLVLNSNFDAKELAQLKEKTKADLMAQRQDEGALAELYFHEKLFGMQMYGLPPQGIPRTVDAITSDDCSHFYQRFYHPNNSMLLVVGGVHSDDIVNKVRVLLGGWTNQPTPPIFTKSARQPVGLLIRIGDRPGSDTAQIRLGRVGVQRTSRDYFNLQMMNFILGGAGSGSRLAERLQKKDHLTGDVSSAFEYHVGGGDWMVRLSTPSASAATAVADILDEIKKFRISLVSDKELTAATDALTARLVSHLQTNDQIADALAQIEVYNLAFDAVSAYSYHLSRVTAEDVQQVAREYLDPDSLVIAVVGDGTAMRTALQKMGTVEVFPGN